MWDILEKQAIEAEIAENDRLWQAQSAIIANPDSTAVDREIAVLTMRILNKLRGMLSELQRVLCYCGTQEQAIARLRRNNDARRTRINIHATRKDLN